MCAKDLMNLYIIYNNKMFDVYSIHKENRTYNDITIFVFYTVLKT